MASCCGSHKQSALPEFEIPQTDKNNNLPIEQPPVPEPKPVVQQEPVLQQSIDPNFTEENETETHIHYQNDKEVYSDIQKNQSSSESSISDTESHMSQGELEALNEHLLIEIQHYQDTIKKHEETIRKMREAELRQIEVQQSNTVFISGIPKVHEASSDNSRSASVSSSRKKEESSSDALQAAQQEKTDMSNDTQSEKAYNRQYNVVDPANNYKEILKQKCSNLDDFLAFKSGMNEPQNKLSSTQPLTQSNLKYVGKKQQSQLVSDVEVIKIDLQNINQANPHNKYIIDDQDHDAQILEQTIKAKKKSRSKDGRCPIVTDENLNTGRFKLSPRHQSLYDVISTK